MKALLLTLAIVCVGAFASAVEKHSQIIGTENVPGLDGMYKLQSVCIWASTYDSLKASEFCSDDAGTINLLSTDSVMLNASCVPASSTTNSTCALNNGYVIRTRMSIAN